MTGYSREEDVFASLPSVARFRERLSRHLLSSNPPQSIFIHAATNAPLALKLVHRLLEERNMSYSVKGVGDGEKPSVQSLLPKLAIVDLDEVHSTRSAFDRILNSLSGWDSQNHDVKWNGHNGSVSNWDGRIEGWNIVRRKRKGERSSLDLSPRHSKRARLEDKYGAGDEVEINSSESTLHKYDDQWSFEWSPVPGSNTRQTLAPLRDTLDMFFERLSTIMSLGQLDEDLTRDRPEGQRWLIFSHAERLHELAAAGNVGGAPKEAGLGMTFASAMYRLRSLSSTPVTTIMISKLGWTKAREGMVGLASPEVFSFPKISDGDASSILTARFARSHASSSLLKHEEIILLFQSLVSVITSTFGTVVRSNLDELAYLCAKFWPKWLLCVEKSNPPIPWTDTARLHAHLKHDFTREMDRIATPRLSLAPSGTSSTNPEDVLQGFVGSMPALPNLTSSGPFDSTSSGPTTPVKQRSISNSPRSSPTKTIALASDQSLAKSLPDLSKWLLLASFYAGFNPPRTDVRFFVRPDDTIAKKGKKSRKTPVRKPGSPRKLTVRPELGGGNAFALERMLAIFEAIVGSEHEHSTESVDVYAQITTLIQIRLLQRVSAQDRILEGIKLKCKLTKDTAENLAKSVGMRDWTDYLFDAEA